MITVYTALTGAYDQLQSAPQFLDVPGHPRPLRYVALTDEASEVSDGWATFECLRIGPGESPRIAQRRGKMLYPVTQLDVGDVAIYHDASMTLKLHPYLIVEECLADSDVAFLRHPDRDNILAEAEEIERLGWCEPGSANDMAWMYRGRGNKGRLWCGGFFAARITPETRAFFMTWWHLYLESVGHGCERDQLALSEAVRNNRVRLHTIDHHPWRSEYFAIRGHRKA